ncbi:MAG: hypothetical protein L0Z07_01365 [Planctomycetes bacterium]|nr:hypothetical protein [Planctomycetota bacterium]
MDPRDNTEVWGPSYWSADLLAGYAVRGLRKGRHLGFQLNLMNVFDERDPLIKRYEFDTGQKLIFRTTPRDPLTWRFTTNYEF